MSNSITTGEITWSWDKSNETVSSIKVTLDGVEIKPISEIINELGYNSTSSSSNCALIKARFVIWSGHDFFNVASYVDEQNDCIAQQYELGQSYLRNKGNNSDILPIIHVSAFPLQGDRTRKVFFPRYSSIMDSSIWNYFFVLDPSFYNDEKESQSDHFKRIIESISKNYIDNRYRLNVALEYADLSARLTFSSFIQSLEGSGHGKAVSPFLFHSERQMKCECDNSRKRIIDYARNLKWRFLLVDDYASVPLQMQRLSNDLEQEQAPNKIQILSRDITEIGLKVSAKSCRYLDGHFIHKDVANLGKGPTSSWGEVEIWSVADTSSALEILRRHEFDIILLDYLLANTNNEEQDSSHDYGYNLLNSIIQICSGAEDRVQFLREDCGFKIGPHSKFFFMFISAFTTAVSERLNFEGLSRNSEIWEIGEGACPTNTPELFKFRLIRLMERRLEQTGIKGLSNKSIKETVESIFKLDSKDDKTRGKHIEAVRNQAYKQYKRILGLHYDYFQLKQYDEGYSYLVNSFLKNKMHMDALLEHLLQFVHLIAFGTVRQWPEIWEEYQFFVRSFDIKIGNSVTSEDLRGLSRLIEDHIIYLKSD